MVISSKLSSRTSHFASQNITFQVLMVQGVEKSPAIEIAYQILVGYQILNFWEKCKLGTWAILLIKVMCSNS
jgi:hypothetical protein